MHLKEKPTGFNANQFQNINFFCHSPSFLPSSNNPGLKNNICHDYKNINLYYHLTIMNYLDPKKELPLEVREFKTYKIYRELCDCWRRQQWIGELSQKQMYWPYIRMTFKFSHSNHRQIFYFNITYYSSNTLQWYANDILFFPSLVNWTMDIVWNL